MPPNLPTGAPAFDDRIFVTLTYLVSAHLQLPHPSCHAFLLSRWLGKCAHAQMQNQRGARHRETGLRVHRAELGGVRGSPEERNGRHGQR